MDFLLKNGKIYDGTGADAFLGDILVRGNRIEKIGEELICDGAQVIDLQGLSVSSGFMDAHSHNDWFAIRKDPRPFFEPFIRQGITSFITGNCGLSATGFAPDTPYLDKIGGGLFGYRGEETGVYPSAGALLDAADGRSPQYRRSRGHCPRAPVSRLVGRDLTPAKGADARHHGTELKGGRLRRVARADVRTGTVCFDRRAEKRSLVLPSGMTVR